MANAEHVRNVPGRKMNGRHVEADANGRLTTERREISVREDRNKFRDLRGNVKAVWMVSRRRPTR